MENKVEVTKEQYTQTNLDMSLDGEDEQSPCQPAWKSVQKIMNRLKQNQGLFEYEGINGRKYEKQ